MTGLSLDAASRPGAVGDLRAAGAEPVRHIASTPEPAGAAPGGPGAPIRNLLSSLDSSGIRYCHWKSNIRLEESFSGKGDLDLLVHREDLAGFQAALLRNGFKFAVSGNGMAHPGVLHAFALDPERLRLLHVHAYLQIATGDSLVKSYRLPFEATLLERTRRLNGIPVPTAAVELVLFAIRIALKHTSLVELMLLRRHYEATSRELQWLRSSADPDEADRVWKEWLPQVPVELFHGLLNAIPDARGSWRRIRLGHRLAWHLRGWRRLGPVAAAGSRWWRVLMLVLGRIRRRRGLVPQSSGIIIGFVGPKATGKSTLTREAARRLGQHFDVRCVHVGKPPPTLLSFLPFVLLPLARRLYAGERSSEYEGPERRGRQDYSLLHLLRTVLIAYDRRALLRRCWRQAAAGSIIITDRYPSPRAGASDSTRFDDETIAQCASPVKRWLMRRERGLYAGLPRPGLVIRLSAPIETTILRDAERSKRCGPDPDAVTRRRQSESEAEFPEVPVAVIDTHRSLDETIEDVMNAVWTRI